MGVYGKSSINGNSVHSSVSHYCNKIPEVINIKEGFMLLIYSFVDSFILF